MAHLPEAGTFDREHIPVGVERAEHRIVTEHSECSPDADHRPRPDDEVIIGKEVEKVTSGSLALCRPGLSELFVEDVDNVTDEVVDVSRPHLAVKHRPDVNGCHDPTVGGDQRRRLDERDNALGYRSQHTFFRLERGEQHELGEASSREVSHVRSELFGCADQTGPLDEFLRDETLLLRLHPAVVTSVDAEVPSIFVPVLVTSVNFSSSHAFFAASVTRSGGAATRALPPTNCPLLAGSQAA